MTGNKKLHVWLPLLFSLVMIAGMFFGYGLSDNKGKGFFQRDKQSTLQEALELIRLKYVDEVPLDSLEDVAIREMMNQLDPHSVYYPPVELLAANEDLAGNFQGIGVEFNIFSDTVNVVYVVPEGPSDRAGLLIGDKILKVDDFSLTSKGLSPDSIKKHIRGEGGSSMLLTILRDNKSKNVAVTRGTIPVPSVEAAYMINETTGYIKLEKFTESSYEEFARSLETLNAQGMKELIYDLRGNGGGYMNEAFEMADEFLDGDKLVVYTEGVNSKKREWRCKRPGLFEKGKLVLLVDELSASASEVLAGALQDWDRATIIGRRTFGKGLVQEQYDLSDGSALRLTVARYYSPLGRSIQRPYDKGKKVYMDEIWERYQNGEVISPDSIKAASGKAYKTNSGKTVYGGGGITPDVFVPIDTSTYPSIVNRLILDGAFNNFVYKYYLQHRKQVDAFTSASDYVKRFNLKEDMWNSFVNAVQTDSTSLRNVTASQRQALTTRLEAYLARFRWRTTGFYQVLNEEDGMVRRAVEFLRS
jgi:carboxyl-terminal processing protease